MLTLSGEMLRQFVVYAGPNPWGERGFQIVVKFPNGWGASIARTQWTLGLELALLRKGDDGWFLTSAIAVDLTVEEVKKVLNSLKEW